jgi:ribonuclease Z
MQLTFLGTSAMVPTKDRNHSAIFLKYEGHGILFDCGEGTQRQLRMEEIKPSHITKILISHWHGDHTLGIPGLLQTLGMSDYQGELEIYGPKGTREMVRALVDLFPLNNRFDLSVHDIAKTRFLDTSGFYIEAYPMEHKVPCLGYRFVEKDRLRINVHKAKELGIPEGPLMGKLQRGESITHKGKKVEPHDVTYKVHGRIIGYVPDTGMCDSCISIAKDVDVLISESTFTKKEEDKAQEYFHLTTTQAAMIAHQANAKKLILTHFSQRYKELSDVEQESKDIFPNTVAAHDFMKVKV